jgi:putative endonuclease
VSERQALGKQGEAIARTELLRLGYSNLATRYRTRFGEIDIVAERAGLVVFVEVKARMSLRRGSAVEALPLGKRRRIAAMALDYLAWSGRLNSRCRFDVIAIDGIGTPGMTLRLIENAFGEGGW